MSDYSVKSSEKKNDTIDERDYFYIKYAPIGSKIWLNALVWTQFEIFCITIHAFILHAAMVKDSSL